MLNVQDSPATAINEQQPSYNQADYKHEQDSHTNRLISEMESEIIKELNDYFSFNGISQPVELIFDMFSFIPNDGLKKTFLENYEIDTIYETAWNALYLIKHLCKTYDLSEQRNRLIERAKQ